MFSCVFTADELENTEHVDTGSHNAVSLPPGQDAALIPWHAFPQACPVGILKPHVEGQAGPLRKKVPGRSQVSRWMEGTGQSLVGEL